ncbi:MAG: C13 family peptidase [bacterium]|nr:C13 family peptidase [bacterium]
MKWAVRTIAVVSRMAVFGWLVLSLDQSDCAIPSSTRTGLFFQIEATSSLQLDPPSPAQTRVGSSVKISGYLLGSATSPPGESVVITFVSPSGDSKERTALTDSSGAFSCDYSPSQAGDWIVEARYQEVNSGNTIHAEPKSFSVLSAETYLIADVSASSVVVGAYLAVEGALRAKEYLDPTGGILGGQTIVLTIYDSSGNPVDSRIATTSGTGRYRFSNVSLPSSGKWFVRLRFDGNGSLTPSATQLLPVRARPSAGYAVIVAGQVPGGSGLDSHNKTTDRAYKKFTARGFKDEDIFYFRYGAPSDPSIFPDEKPRQEPGDDGDLGIREAIVTWAKNKMNASNGPLYIVFVNHGNDEKFYVDPSAADFEDRIIRPAELDGWISQLEDGLLGAAAEEEIVFIYGACYSGSFIPGLSRESKRRVVITSADPNEQSFKGPMEEDGVRDGEFFVTQLFAALERGLNLKRSFEVATDVTEAYTSNESGNGGVSDGPYADQAAQHPLLDDNGDGNGTNDALSAYLGNDGAVSAKMILGYDYAADQTARLLSVSPAKHLGPTDGDPVLEATVSDSTRAGEIWVTIKPPKFDLGDPQLGVSEQREIAVPQLHFDSQPTTGTFRLYNFNKEGFSGFNTAGRYEVFYFLKDSETGSLSVLKRSFVYRSLNTADQPPKTFDLLAPGDGSVQNTLLFLDWEDSVDPENQTVSYTVEISTDSSFAAPEFVIEGVDGSGVMVDELVGLDDLTHYFWRVIAVDSDGNRTPSTQSLSFDTNDTNAWGNYNVLTSIVRNFNDPATWPPGSVIEIQPYIGTIYNHFYTALVPLGDYSVDSEAPEFSHEHDDAQVIEESPTTVLQLPEPNSGTVTGTVKDTATLSSIRGASVCLEVTTGIYTGTKLETFSGDDGGFYLNGLFGAVEYRITVEKNFYSTYQNTFTLTAGENKNIGTVQIGFEDADSDGLPDNFEQLIVDADPGDEINDIWDVHSTDDFDGDDATNGGECAASTDPTSAESFLRIASVCKQPDGTVTMTWTSEPGVYYEIYYTDNPSTWTKADGPIAASVGETTSWTDDGSKTSPPPADATMRCYRVQVY